MYELTFTVLFAHLQKSNYVRAFAEEEVGVAHFLWHRCINARATACKGSAMCGGARVSGNANRSW